MTHHAIEVLEKASDALRWMRLPRVHVGPATVALHLESTDLAAHVDPGDEVDCIVEFHNAFDRESFESTLLERGFRHPELDPDELAGRWGKDGIRYRFADAYEALAPDDWGWPAGEGVEEAQLPSGRALPILGVPYLLAFRITSLRDRGGSPYEGREFQDIVLMLEGSDDFGRRVAESEPRVRTYLSNWATECVEDKGYAQWIKSFAGGTDERTWQDRTDRALRRTLWLKQQAD